MAGMLCQMTSESYHSFSCAAIYDLQCLSVRYEQYFRRFKDIFAADEGLLMYYLPGNHDIG